MVTQNKPTGGYPPRMKDMSKESLAYYNTLSSKTKSFVDEYYNLTGRTLELTSGARPKGKTTSHHYTGNALDIKATHTEDYEWLMNTKEGLGLLAKYKMGVIDETDPVTMEKTGATGPHFHLGQDSRYAAQITNRLKNFDNERQLVSYNKWISQGNLPEDFTPYGEELHDHSHEYGEATKDVVPIKDFVTAQIDMRVVEKEIVKETKMDDDRKELMARTEALTNKRQSILNDYTSFINSVDRNPIAKFETQNQRQPAPQLEQVQLQNYDLNIFNQG